MLKVGYAERHVSSVYYNIINTPIVRVPAYSIHDFTLGLALHARLALDPYPNDAFDKRNQTGAFDVTVLGYVLRLYVPPRLFSVEAGTRF